MLYVIHDYCFSALDMGHIQLLTYNCNNCLYNDTDIKTS